MTQYSLRTLKCNDTAECKSFYTALQLINIQISVYKTDIVVSKPIFKTFAQYLHGISKLLSLKLRN